MGVTFLESLRSTHEEFNGQLPAMLGKWELYLHRDTLGIATRNIFFLNFNFLFIFLSTADHEYEK